MITLSKSAMRGERKKRGRKNEKEINQEKQEVGTNTQKNSACYSNIFQQVY